MPNSAATAVGRTSSERSGTYTGTLPTVDVESLRLLSRERGEYLWKHASEEVQRSKGGPAAVRAATDVLRHQASIDGLTQQTLNVQTTPTPEELTRWAASLLQSVGFAVPQEADIFEGQPAAPVTYLREIAASDDRGEEAELWESDDDDEQ